MLFKLGSALIITVLLSVKCSSQLLVDSAIQRQGISFDEQSSTWREIIEKAKNKNMYVFVDVYASWCGPCKQMDKSVYVDDSLGRFMRDHFISVKVQADTTAKDNERVKKWYPDAHYVTNNFNVYAYPSFLFFNSDGLIINKEIGYKSVEEFNKLAHAALESKNQLFYALLADYKAGKRDYVNMDDLAGFVRRVLNNDSLSRRIARDYLEHTDLTEANAIDYISLSLDINRNRKMVDSLFKIYKQQYLNKMSDSEFCTREKLLLIDRFAPDAIDSRDKLFTLCYQRPEMMDSTIGFQGWSRMQVDSIISKEEIGEKAGAESKSISSAFWSEAVKNIHDKYRRVDAERIVLDFEIKYYSLLKNWQDYNKAVIKRVDRYGPFGQLDVRPFGQIDVPDFNYNNHAWRLFQHSSDRAQLSKALSWSNMAINMVSSSKVQDNLTNWMDTKANILYKMGRIEEAIKLERNVVLLSPLDQSFKVNLKKMESRLPTW